MVSIWLAFPVGILIAAVVSAVGIGGGILWKTARPYRGWVSLMAAVSGMLSVSIGEWLVPLLRGRMALRMRSAVATSVTTVCGTCVLGAVFHHMLGGRPQWAAIAWAVPGVLLGGQVGPRLAGRITNAV